LDVVYGWAGIQGDVDVICGGPPCQGASGFNRFRNYEKPLDDPKNKQMVVYMDIVEFLRPRFILMENVVDILKFCDGILGRYALSRAVSMNYQVSNCLANFWLSTFWLVNSILLVCMD
jgi:DNA (cytosine-5)-methyltransferase 1